MNDFIVDGVVGNMAFMFVKYTAFWYFQLKRVSRQADP